MCTKVGARPFFGATIDFLPFYFLFLALIDSELEKNNEIRKAPSEISSEPPSIAMLGNTGEMLGFPPRLSMKKTRRACQTANKKAISLRK